MKTLSDSEQIEARPLRIRGLRDYLNNCVTNSYITPGIGHAAWMAWCQVDLWAGDSLDIPDACPTPDGGILLTWDKDLHHLELEVESDAKTGFFYADRIQNAAWELSPRLDGPLDADIKKVLDIFSLNE